MKKKQQRKRCLKCIKKCGDYLYDENILKEYLKKAEKIKNENERNEFLISKNICPICKKISLVVKDNEKYCSICGQVFDNMIFSYDMPYDEDLKPKNITSEVSKILSYKTPKLKNMSSRYVFYTDEKRVYQALTYINEIISLLDLRNDNYKILNMSLEEFKHFYKKYKKSKNVEVMFLSILAIRKVLFDYLNYLATNKQILEMIEDYHNYKERKDKKTNKKSNFKLKKNLNRIIQIEIELDGEKYRNKDYLVKEALLYFKYPLIEKNIENMEKILSFVLLNKI
ncbi:MAG: hypothetical protein ACP5IV_07910, partial [Caldisericia bacterium]